VKIYALYGAVLIGLYIAVQAGTSSGTLIDKSTSGLTSVVKAFQGR
jgi:hypothetical protein